MDKIPVEYPQNWTDYELLDSGNGQKLERFGEYTLVRPEPRAIWQPELTKARWQATQAALSGSSKNERRFGTAHHKWQIKQQPPSPWIVSWQKIRLSLRLADFKNLGIFPEQAANWEWLQKVLTPNQQLTTGNRQPKILNLFAYTGAASIIAAQAGAKVTHLDSVKSINTWAKENARFSELKPDAIRWVEDDAYKFVSREAKRGNTYDGIILDPPRFGHGDKGQVWKLNRDLPKLLQAITKILSPEPSFVLLNIYTADLSPIATYNLLTQTMTKFKGQTTYGELALKPTDSDYLLPAGIFARWQKA